MIAIATGLSLAITPDPITTGHIPSVPAPFTFGFA